MTRSLLSQPSDKIKKAKTHLAKATALLHQEPIDKQALGNRIRAAMNRCLEEWFALKPWRRNAWLEK
jgi:hypothetical protein